MQLKALSESALVLTIFIIMSFVAFYLPFGVILTLGLAIPHAVITFRHNLRAGLVALGAGSILLLLLMDIFTAVVIIGLFACPGVALGFGAKRYSAIKTVLLGAAVASIGFALQVYLFAAIGGLNFFDDSLRLMHESLEQMQQMGVEVGNIEELRQVITMMFTTLVPTLVLLSGFAPSYVNYKIMYLLGKRIKIQVPPVPNLLYWNFPKWMGIAFVTGNLLSMGLVSVPILQKIGINLVYIFVFPVLFQGFALIISFLSQYVKSRIMFFLLFMVTISNPFLLQVVVLLGLFDMFFDYRGWIKERSGQ